MVLTIYVQQFIYIRVWCRPVVVEQVACQVAKQCRVFGREETAGNLIYALLQLYVLVVVLSRLVSESNLHTYRN